jgi:hypothetical protein
MLHFVQNVIRSVENYNFCNKKSSLLIYKMAEETPLLDISRNDLAELDGVMTGNLYAIGATGGFTMERGYNTVRLAEQEAPILVDVINSVQVTMSVDVFNTALGEYDTVTDSYANDEITISAADFADSIAVGNVISVGLYETLYTDFEAYVRAYFGNSGGFESLFTGASEFSAGVTEGEDADVFGAAEFVALLTGAEAEEEGGPYVSDLSGSITITNIAKLLKYVVDGNVFGNRDPAEQDYGLADKFLPGDLIWVPEGTTIVLKVAIDRESFAPLNNVGPTTGGIYLDAQTTNAGAVNYTSETVATTELITRTVTAPLLIKLATL